jgi:pyruvate dehydrogenase E1 component alpha subunit
MRRLPQIVCVVFGDGAANEGIFHESLNMAGLWRLPVLFVCENNHYGMSMEISQAAAKLPIAIRADVYDMPGRFIDGNDVLLVYETMCEAVEHVSSGKGPFLVEAETYRYFGHSKSDRNLYRTKDEIDEWKRKDPIIRFRNKLIEAGIISVERAQETDVEASKTIDVAVEFAEASPEPEVSSLREFVYA